MPPPTLRSRLPQVGTTVFSVISAQAAQWGAINLSQGFPDFDAPPHLLDLLDRHARAGHNQYAPMTGLPALREALAAKVEALYGHRAHVDHDITITAGATQALFTAIAALVHPGDEVLAFAPVFDSYGPAVQLQGARLVVARLQPPHWRPDWAEVARLITPRTRLVIVNSPHNPSGAVWSMADLEALHRLVKGTDIVVLSDEVYEHMVFDGRTHTSVLQHPGLAERSVVVSSFGKTFHVTGWKVAHAMAPRALMAEFRKVHQFLVFSVHAPSQHALADAMRDTGWYAELAALYQAKRDRFRAGLAGTPYELLPCEGTYFQCVRHPGVASAGGDVAFVQQLMARQGVAAIPVSAFHPDGHDEGVIRFCFAKRDETLDRALERLHAPPK